MPLSDKQTIEFLSLRVAALEKAMEALTGAYDGLMIDHVSQNTADSDIIAQAEAIKPKKVKK